jgi:ABC-type lipoprotein export system ATPase subunit
MNDEQALARARGLRKEYGSGEGLVRAVDAVDLDVARGETLAIMGPSGCGKSTLLHLMGGLDRPSAGRGRPAPGHGRQQGAARRRRDRAQLRRRARCSSGRPGQPERQVVHRCGSMTRPSNHC